MVKRATLAIDWTVDDKEIEGHNILLCYLSVNPRTTCFSGQTILGVNLALVWSAEDGETGVRISVGSIKDAFYDGRLYRCGIKFSGEGLNEAYQQQVGGTPANLACVSPADKKHEESDDEGWEEREASRTHSVKFTDDVDSDVGKETPFVRQNTPHPKELKAKAHKLFGKGKPGDSKISQLDEMDESASSSRQQSEEAQPEVPSEQSSHSETPTLKEPPSTSPPAVRQAVPQAVSIAPAPVITTPEPAHSVERDTSESNSEQSDMELDQDQYITALATYPTKAVSLTTLIPQILV
ncbi:unnamed protein product, partial [Timema podura]|nr:unnamed protein product [Timema podura]